MLLTGQSMGRGERSAHGSLRKGVRSEVAVVAFPMGIS